MGPARPRPNPMRRPRSARTYPLTEVMLTPRRRSKKRLARWQTRSPPERSDTSDRRKPAQIPFEGFVDPRSRTRSLAVAAPRDMPNLVPRRPIGAEPTPKGDTSDGTRIGEGPPLI